MKKVIKRQLSKLVEEETRKLEKENFIDYNTYLKQNPHLKKVTLTKLFKEIKHLKTITSKLLCKSDEDVLNLPYFK